MHGNSNQNNNPHHLYEIWDKQEGEVFKYGISDKPIETDGLSGRVREQVYLLNLAVNWLRYLGRILIYDIPNRLKAKELEQQYIDDFESENGVWPRGNPLRRPSRFEQNLPDEPV